RQSHRPASCERAQAARPQARHRHRVHRWRAGRGNASGGGVMTVSKDVWKLLKQRNVTLGPQDAEWQQLTHWRWAKDAEGLVWLIFDRAGESANTLSIEALAELDKVIGEVHASGARGLVIRSAKSSGFVAGADIR